MPTITFKRSSILLLSLSILFAFMRSTYAAETAVTPTHFLPGDDTIGGAAGQQLTPNIAQGGDTLLAVWADYRSAPTDLLEFETYGDIYGMRLDASGNPLDAPPFAITQGPATQTNPTAVWNGTHWLVVYESYSVSGTGYYYQKSLEAVRVSPSGEILDTTPIRIFGVIPFISSWAVASDGTEWVVVFHGEADGYDLKAVRITAAGTVELPAQSLVPGTYYLRFNLRLAYAGGVYLFTWQGIDDTEGIRFDQALQLLDATPQTILNDVPNAADLTSNGSQFYLVWHQQQPDFSTAVMGSRISTAGVKLDGSGVNISDTHEPQPYTTTAVVWDGTNWKITWTHNGTLYLARVNSAGQVLDPGGVAVSGPSGGNAAATSTGGVQLIWEQYTTENNVVSANIAPDNSAGTNQTLSLGSPMQIWADTAVGSNGYMVVFQSQTATAHRIMAQPLDGDGNPLTTEPIQLASGPILNGPGAPTIAWNGSLYLAAWSIGNNVFAQRIQQDGTLVDAAPFVVMTGFGTTDVAALGDLFLVVAHKIDGYPEYVVPVAARVQGTNGAVLDNPALVIGGSYARSLAVTPFDNRWLVVWQQNFSHDDPMAGTAFTFVNADGTFSPSATAYGPYSTAGGNGLFEIGLAASDTMALLVQSNELTSGVETDLVSQTIYPNGSLGTAVNLTPWIGNQYRPRVAWDGSQFIVVFNDQKNRFAPHTLDQLDARSDLFGMRISASGTVIDPKGFAFSTSPLAEAFPNIAASAGVSFLSNSLMRNEAPFAAYRVGYTRYGVGGNGWPVAVASGNVTSGIVPFTVNFSATGSSDPDGTVASYLWDFGDGTTSTQANPAHLYTTAGNYVTHLTVTDDEGATSVNTVAIQANNPNQLPVAVATAVPASGPPPLDVTFYAAGSYDPDGSIGNIRWTFEDGSESWGATTYNSYTELGSHLVTMTVWDNNGATDTTTVTVTVTGPDVTPPDAPVVTNPADGSITNQDPLTFVGTTEPGARIDVHEVGSGIICTVTAVANGNWQCTPANLLGEGSHTFNVIATDAADNASEPTTLTVTIDQTTPSAPEVAAPADGSITNQDPLNFAGTTEPGAQIDVHEVGGSVVCTATAVANGNWQCTSISLLGEGGHIFNVVATDAAGNASVPTTLTVTIDQTAPPAPEVNAPTAGEMIFWGTAEPGTTLTMTDEGGNVICETAVPPNGAWECTLAAPLPAGTHQFYVTAVDAAGNISPVSTFTVIVPYMTFLPVIVGGGTE